MVLVLVLQLGLVSSWSWVVPTLKVLAALVTFRAAGMAAARVALFNLKHYNISSDIVGRIMVAAHSILISSAWWFSLSEVAITATMNAVISRMSLFAIGFMGALLLHDKHIDFQSPCPSPGMVLIIVIKSVVTTVISILTNPSIPWSWVVTAGVVIKVSLTIATIGLGAVILSNLLLPWHSDILRKCIDMTFQPLYLVLGLCGAPFGEAAVLCREIWALIRFSRHILMEYFFWPRMLPST